MSLAIGDNSLLLVPAGFNPAAVFGSYGNLGLTHTVGTTLILAAGQGFSGIGSLSDHVNCQGTISAAVSGSINLNGGVTVSGTGNVSLGNGSCTVNDTQSRMTGGSLSVSFLNICNQGSFQFGGGTLQINGSGLANQGVFDATQSTGMLTVTGSAIVDLSQATLVNTGSMSLFIGPDSLLLVPAGFNPVAAFGRYGIDPTSLVHNAGTPLILMAGQGFSGQGSIVDHVNCQGTILAAPGGSVNLNGGVTVSGTGSVSLGGGSFTVNDTTSGISGGSLTVPNGFVGYSGTGTFTQSGGTNNITSFGGLYIGYNAGDAGTYALSGSGAFSADLEYVGYSGAGTFTQSGGTNNSSYGTLCVGYNAGGNGTYSLAGSGLLSTYSEYVGSSGTGTFTQSGGTNNIGYFGGGWYGASSVLYLGNNSGSSGSYVLSGSGLLSVQQEPEYVGYSGTGTFTQSGGTNNVGSLCLGNNLGSSGSYNLSGSGLLTPQQGEIVGYSGTGTFTQSGGMNDLYDIANPNGYGYLYIGNNSGSSGSYSLSGSGQLSAFMEYVGLSGAGTFTQWGGTNSSSYVYLGNNSGSNGSYTLTGSGVLSASGEYVGLSGTGTFTQYGGTNSSTYLYLGTGSSSIGSYNLSGSGLLFASSQFVGNSGMGTLTQSGGTNNLGSDGSLDVGYNAGSIGSYNLSGSGLLTAQSVEYVGYSGTGTFTQSGGTNSIRGKSALCLGEQSGSSGSYSLSGSGLLSAYNEAVGISGTGTFTQSGGTNMVMGAFSLGSAGTYNLTGGALLVPGIRGTGAFNLGGGTLVANASFSTSQAMTLTGNGNINTGGYPVTLFGVLSGPGGLSKIGSGPLTLATANTFGGNTLVSGGTLALGSSLALQNSTLDSSGSGVLSFGSLVSATLGGLTGPGMLSLANSASSAIALTVGANNAGTTFSGMLEGAGGLTKVGGGVLALSGSNTYSGPTTISQGKLVVDGWLTNAAVSVNGGTLGGTGYLSSVTVNAGGQLAPGDSLGMLSISGGLTLESGIVMDYDLDTPSTSDMISCGSLALDLQQFSDFNFTPTVNFGQGNYDLICFGSSSGSLGANTSGTIDGYAATLTVQGNDLVLNVVPEPSTLALLGVGSMGLLSYVAWRRKKRRPSASLSLAGLSTLASADDI